MNKPSLPVWSMLSLALILAGCTTAVPVSPSDAALAQTAAATVTVPAQVATTVSGAATAAPAAATALAQVTLPPVTAPPITPLPPEVAATVISTYARSQLGIEVRVLQAVGGVGELQLPETAQAGVREAISLAGVSYGAALQGGLAVVALGRGEGTGDYEAQIPWASLGAFTMRSTAAYPADEAGALALVKQTFPALAELAFTAESADGGYAFHVSTTTSATDPSTGGTQTVARVVLAGVTRSDVGNLVLVYAIIGNGALAEPLRP